MNKSIVISGGSQGIGKALVKIFLNNGYKVITCSRKIEKLEKLKHELQSENLLIFQADLSKKEQVKNFADFVFNSISKIDILINNAGFFLPGSIQNEEDNVLESQIETNVYSAYHLTRAILPNLLENKSGQIFNICSTASITPYESGGSYCISKFALLGFSKVLREELKEKGIKVTSVLPGATLTPSWDGVDLPKERFIDVDELAKTIFNISQLDKTAVVEEILIRPQLGDI
jgi:short-subunit dehydrogenase